MAFKNKQIKNPKTGQEIKFLLTAEDTDGKLLEMEALYNPHTFFGSVWLQADL